MNPDPTAPAPDSLPQHIAIVMDGNGRWARTRGSLRADGHRAGVEPVRMVIQECSRRGIAALTLFAFSSENWNRPRDEVMSLMALFVESLEAEVDNMARNGVRIRFIGERSALDAKLRASMAASEQSTRANSRLSLQIAVSYGGRRDILGAARHLAAQVQRGERAVDSIDEAAFSAALALGGLPDPDLFIRTGGEQRVSNFLLWNLAYTELYFTEQLWPDFDVAAFVCCATALRRQAAAVRADRRTAGRHVRIRLSAMLRSRILTALALAALYIAAILYPPPLVTALMLGLILLVGSWEWLAFLDVSTGRRWPYALLLAGLGICRV